MFMRLPTAEEMAAQGLLPEDYDETVEVFPENWAAWRLFCELQGQWRAVSSQLGGVIRYAMDYGPLFARLDRLALTPEAWQDLYDDVRTLEVAALNQLHS